MTWRDNPSHAYRMVVHEVMIDSRRSTAMNRSQTWQFTCKTCGGHDLSVTRIWTILAGPNSERWQEWGPLEADHHWHYEFKERVEENPNDKDERGDFGEYQEDDSASEPEEYEVFEPENNPESDEFYVNCANCDREIEFGWTQPDRGGLIVPVECSDFVPGESWPEPRYRASWQQKHWLRTGGSQP
jgi:hypothetical protein